MPIVESFKAQSAVQRLLSILVILREKCHSATSAVLLLRSGTIQSSAHTLKKEASTEEGKEDRPVGQLCFQFICPAKHAFARSPG